MSERQTILSNAAALLEQLDARQIAERLQHLEAEKQALRVLLRAARARERSRGPDGGRGRNRQASVA